MNKIYTVFLLLISFQAEIFSQANWVWQNPVLTGNDLYNIQFTDSTTGYASGDNFTILKTTSSGENWSNIKNNLVPAGNNGSFKAMCFINSLTGYVGRDGIYKTTNGGDSWTYSTTYNLVNSIHFTSSNTGYAVCNEGKIIKTTNSGDSWFLIYSDLNSAKNFLKIDFTSPDTGFVVGSFKTVLKTTNQGNNWVMKNGSTSSYIFFDIDFINALTGYVSTEYLGVFKTTDGGENWTVQQPTITNSYLQKIAFVSADTGYVVSNMNNSLNGRIFKTTNGGTEWSTLADLNTYVYDLEFINSISFATACETGNVSKSTDRGLTWLKKNSYFTDSELFSVSFISSNSGFAAGSNNLVLKTTNGGIEWQKGNVPVNENFTYIKVFENGIGYLAGDRLYKTNDFGLSWFKLNNLMGINSELFKHVEFMNSDTGYIFKVEKLYKTFDGGITWIIQNTPYSHRFFFCENNDTGYSIDSYSIYPNINYMYTDINKTTNNGLSWSRIRTLYSGYNRYYTYIFFINGNTGFLSGSAEIVKTTNGGVDWDSVSGITGATGDLFFHDENTGYASGINGIYKTMDSGNNWHKILQTSKKINSFSFTNDMNTGYAVGQYGYILKTVTGGGVGVNTLNENIPLSFDLHQNYPNPFNPVTTIRYSLNRNQFINLKVFDVLGKEVAVMVNEKQNAGEYSIEFNGNDLPSGIYFYKMEAGEFVSTKKMMLIK